MSKEAYTVENVIRILNRIQGISIKDNTIRIVKDSVFGLKVLGKIDFLKKNGYTLVITNQSISKKEDKIFKEDFEEHKRKKKNNKIDALSPVKSAMKNINIKTKR